MRIAVGSDHAGFEMKEMVVNILRESGHEVEDMGADSDGPVDYPDYAAKVTSAVTGGLVERGVLVCGTGIGMSIAANRMRGIRAAACYTEEMAVMSRSHNDANVLCLGQRMTSGEDAGRILRAWLETAFDGGRHKRRLAKIERG